MITDITINGWDITDKETDEQWQLRVNIKTIEILDMVSGKSVIVDATNELLIPTNRQLHLYRCATKALGLDHLSHIQDP